MNQMIDKSTHFKQVCQLLLSLIKAIKNGRKTRLQVMLAQKPKKRRNDLAQFIPNRGSRVLDEATAVGWELGNAESTLHRSKMTRIEILYTK